MKDMKRRRILLVDDESNILKVVTKRLQVSGFEVATATNGADALEQALAQPPDLIILDVMLPKLGGLEVCARLKSDPRCRQVPIVLFTAKTEEKDRQAGLAAGADAYLTKPYQSEELRQVLARLLDHASPHDLS